MEMEVVVPLPPPPPVDFNFDSSCSSPYMTAPSSPQRFGNFFCSAPASPTRISTFCTDISSSSIAFQDYEDVGDFEFNFSGQLDKNSLSADELFDGGKIRPYKPPLGYDSSVSSPRSKTGEKKDFDSFRAALEQTRRKEIKNQQNEERGRERKTSNYVCKGSRSLSPLRLSDLILSQEEEKNIKSHNPKIATNSYKSFSFLSTISFSYKKWKLKDFLLFRSASEGRATDIKNDSFRSTDSSVGGSSRRRGPVSAHELHYTANRAVSEELKRKTFLPYKQGLLGCLGFNPGVHEISRGVGSLTSG